MVMKLRSYLMSSTLAILLILSSSMMTGIKSMSNAKDIFDPKTRESYVPSKDAIRLSILDSCFSEWLSHMSDGVGDTGSNRLLLKCLQNGIDAAKKQFGVDNVWKE